MSQAHTLFLMTALKMLSEIALLALVGRWLLGVLLGQRRQENLIYQLLDQMGRPWVRLTRWMTPAVVLDQHIPLVTGLLLCFAWLLLTMAKIEHCLQLGVALCR